MNDLMPSVEELDLKTFSDIVSPWMSHEPSKHDRKVVDTLLMEWQHSTHAWDLIYKGIFTPESASVPQDVKVFLATSFKNKLCFDFYTIPQDHVAQLADTLLNHIRTALVLEGDIRMTELLAVALAHIAFHLKNSSWPDPLQTYEDKLIGDGSGEMVEVLTGIALYVKCVKAFVEELVHNKSIIIQQFHKRRIEHYCYETKLSSFLQVLTHCTRIGAFNCDTTGDSRMIVVDILETLEIWLKEAPALAIIDGLIGMDLIDQIFRWACSNTDRDLVEKSLVALAGIAELLSRWISKANHDDDFKKIETITLLFIERICSEPLLNRYNQAKTSQEFWILKPFVRLVSFSLLASNPTLMEFTICQGEGAPPPSEKLLPRQRIFATLLGIMMESTSFIYDADDRDLSCEGIPGDTFAFWWHYVAEFLEYLPVPDLDTSPVKRFGPLSTQKRLSPSMDEDKIKKGTRNLLAMVQSVIATIPHQLRGHCDEYPTATMDYQYSDIPDLYMIPTPEIDSICRSSRFPIIDATEPQNDFYDFYRICGKLIARAMRLDPEAGFLGTLVESLPLELTTDKQHVDAMAILIILAVVVRYSHPQDLEGPGKVRWYNIASEVLNRCNQWFPEPQLQAPLQAPSPYRLAVSMHTIELLHDIWMKNEVRTPLIASNLESAQVTFQLWTEIIKNTFVQLRLGAKEFRSSPDTGSEIQMSAKLCTFATHNLRGIISRPPELLDHDDLYNSVIPDIIDMIVGAYDEIPANAYTMLIEKVAELAGVVKDDVLFLNLVLNRIFDPIYNRLEQYLQINGPQIFEVLGRPDYQLSQVVSVIMTSSPFLDAGGLLLGLCYRYDFVTLVIRALTGDQYNIKCTTWQHPAHRQNSEIPEIIFKHVVAERMWRTTAHMIQMSQSEELSEKGVRCMKYMIRLPRSEAIQATSPFEYLKDGCSILQATVEQRERILSCHLYMGQLFGVDAFRRMKQDDVEVATGVKSLFETLANKTFKRLQQLSPGQIPQSPNDLSSHLRPLDDIPMLLEDYFGLIASFMKHAPVICASSPLFSQSVRLALEVRWMTDSRAYRQVGYFLKASVKALNIDPQKLSYYPIKEDLEHFWYNLHTEFKTSLDEILKQLMEVLVHGPTHPILHAIYNVISAINEFATLTTVAQVKAILMDTDVVPAEVFPTDEAKSYFLAAFYDDEPDFDYEEENDSQVDERTALFDALRDFARIGRAVFQRKNADPLKLK